MDITVCIKQVPGTSEVKVDPETGVLQRDGIDSKMNPYDLYAIETALRLKESKGGKVRAVTMGPPQAEQILREAFMMGADEAFLISDRQFAGSDVLATAYTLSQGIMKSGSSDLIICGKQTTDGDTAQVGAEIAEFLNIPHVTNVRSILKTDEESITVEMDMPHTVEIARVLYPCLISVEKGIYQSRLPSYVKKKETVGKPITVLSLKDLPDQGVSRYGLKGSPTQVERIFPPETRDDHEVWSGSSKELTRRLFEKLRDEKLLVQ
ncbi:electron transfer flavoprotein subunit beta/FixA family protein [Oceanispirochaeta sp.]|jgi:electron transfer flavoprotein beta subunit|uniref:electron transfer flavoprotein subunit beta/FixA family protein n=1 Tax=Oceanispirochaeta sp. TaxID=2035350 RepID=UPI00261B9117|nr:electron transfer flavoprotein subunit beta/FixA family protein [Oceanispirochaeta sp.]MDA3955126.1 electron transfer flavoprotein subunit beta/FixA family protein [Oceanispirochaeta sp.]